MIARLFAPFIAAVLTVAALALASPAQAQTSSGARDWIVQTSGQPGEWIAFGDLALPSGTIFIGDPSWADESHLRGATQVPAPSLSVYVHFNAQDKQVNAVWLEAGGGAPVDTFAALDFGMDSAYFAFGDLGTGQAIYDLRTLGIAGAMDSHAFFFNAISEIGFTADWLEVPPNGLRAMTVTTGADGGLKAVWTQDAAGAFSGILIDITGRASDGTYLDLFITPQS